MYKKDERIVEAIAARLAKVATEEDLRVIAVWRMESERNEALYQRITTKEVLEKSIEEFRQEDVQRAWERVERLMNASRPRRYTFFRRYAAAAAAALIVLPLTWWLTSRAPLETGEELPDTRSSAKVQLVLSDGTTIPVNEGNASIIRDSAGTVIRQEEGHLDYSQNEALRDTTPIFNEIIMANGMEYTMTLSDGTKIFLNAESKLRFPVKFTGKKRVVEFEGEGYFEVAHDPQHPFIVRAGGMEVTVLGTEFNLRAYKDEPTVETTLVEGSVRVSNGKEEFRIVPGEQGVYEHGTKRISTRQVDVTLYTAWHRNEIKFKDMPLEDVMRDLARWYGIVYEFLDESSRKIEFGGCFDRFEHIDPILDMLRRTELVEVVVRESVIYISKKK
ncbi:MAG: FecR domain-containing protein [Odoribacteraceae bacterium]|jgi:ferric-dicitrate binding protein FerR (iron transport regulator)|nr:FecR domain-containing protein [Odoribacteraceae bacterium]